MTIMESGLLQSKSIFLHSERHVIDHSDTKDPKLEENASHNLVLST